MAYRFAAVLYKVPYMLLQVQRKLAGCLAEGIFVVGRYEGHEIHGIVVILVGPRHRYVIYIFFIILHR